MNVGQYVGMYVPLATMLMVFYICVYKKLERIQKIIEELKAKIEKKEK